MYHKIKGEKNYNAVTEKGRLHRLLLVKLHKYANSLQWLLNWIDDKRVGELHAMDATMILNLKIWSNAAFYNIEQCAEL